MRIFDVNDEKDLLREFRSEAKDAEFVRWVAASSKMREEVNQVLRIMKKIIKKVNKNTKDSDKMKETIKAMGRYNDDVRMLISEVLRNQKDPSILLDNPVFRELSENIRRIEDQLQAISTGEILQDSPFAAELRQKIEELEHRIGQVQTRIMR